MTYQTYPISISIGGHNVTPQQKTVMRKGYWKGDSLYLVNRNPVKFKKTWAIDSSLKMTMHVQVAPLNICCIEEDVTNIGDADFFVVFFRAPILQAEGIEEGEDANLLVKKVRDEWKKLAC